MSVLDRFLAAVAPTVAERRARARLRLSAMERARAHYDAADAGRRGASLRRMRSDPNEAVAGGQLPRLRAAARDMVRNNAWARRGVEVIAVNTIAGGILPHARGPNAETVEALMRAHFDTAAIDATGRHDLYGLQRLAMAATVESGEALIRRRWRRPDDGLPLPFQIEVLEADFLDASRDGPIEGGGQRVQGVEFDALGRRVAYWLFREHPGAKALGRSESRRVAAEDVAHLYRVDRPGQVRGVPWLAPVLVRLKDFAGFEDAQLMRQKIAACFSVFVTEPDGVSAPLGDGTGSNPERQEHLEPGIIEHLPPGKGVSFASPPGAEGYADYSRTQLRAIAAGLGITYEALSADLSQVNFSSGRMGWIEMHRNVHAWQQHVMLPGMLAPVARWFGEAAFLAERLPVQIEWTPPRREMIDPTREVPALRDAVRSGQVTPSGMIRQLGGDPDRHWQEFADDLGRLDALGVTVEADPRVVAGARAPQQENPS